MNDANGHPLAVNDLVHPANDLTTTLRINAFNGGLCECRFPAATIGPPMKFYPQFLIWISTPA